MLSSLRARLPRRGDDAGMTLMELVVVGVLASIIMAMTLNFFVGSLTSSDATTSDSIDTAKARVILDDWSSLIRVAGSPTDPKTGTGRFAQVGANEIVFYANLGNRTGNAAATAPVKVDLSITDGQLIQEQYTATNANTDPYSAAITYPSQPTSRTVLAGCTGDTAATQCGTPGTISASPLFTPYYSATGCPILTAAGLCKIDTNSPASLDDVVAIGITFTYAPPGSTRSKTFTTLAATTAGSA